MRWLTWLSVDHWKRVPEKASKDSGIYEAQLAAIEARQVICLQVIQTLSIRLDRESVAIKQVLAELASIAQAMQDATQERKKRHPPRSS